MTPQERLYCYCQLRLHGYTHDETEKIIEEIEEKMKSDNQK